MTVSREEFDRLAERVMRIERSLAATIEIVAAEVVGLRTHIDDRFDAVDRRFEGVDERLGVIDGRLEGVDGRLEGVDGRLEGVDRRLEGVDERLGVLDGRLGSVETKLESYTEQVQRALTLGSDAAARHERFSLAIADHFGIKLDDS